MGRRNNASMIEGLQEGLRRLQLSDLRVSDVQFVQLRDRWKVTSGGYEPLSQMIRMGSGFLMARTAAFAVLAAAVPLVRTAP